MTTAGITRLRRLLIGAKGNASPAQPPEVRTGCRHHVSDAASKTPPKMFETRSQAWKEVGLLQQISPRVVKRARLEVFVLLPLFVAVVTIYHNRVSLFGEEVTTASPTPTRLSPGAQVPGTGARNADHIVLSSCSCSSAGRSRATSAAASDPRCSAARPGHGGHRRLPDPPRTVVMALIVALRSPGSKRKRWRSAARSPP